MIKEFLELFNHSFTLFIIFPAILTLGLFLTIKLRFAQILKLKESLFILTKKREDKNEGISRFGAISAVLAGNLGTGNISGMAVAIATGGPGALVWMWIMAFFGASIQYASCVLGVHFRKKVGQEYAGGPMYYLRDGLGYTKIASCFAIATLFGAITVGNFAQTNSLILPFEQLGFNPFYCSLIIAGLVAMVMLGGIKRFAHLASMIVPFKALIYLSTCFVILFLNYEKIIPAFTLMFQHAFGLSSVVGGVLGISVLKAITTGFDRGLFATDAGTGIVPILQSNAMSDNPKKDGIATLIAPLVVMIVCTATGLVLLITDAWLEKSLHSTNMVTFAFTKGLDSPLGGYIVIGSLLLFAYTTILAWAYCGEKAVEFLVGPEKRRLFQTIYIALIPLGSFFHVSMIWTLADIAISLMLIINLIGIIGLIKQVIPHQIKVEG